MRDFMEERKQQLIDEELERTVKRVFGDDQHLLDIWRQNPTMALFLRMARLQREKGKLPCPYD